MINSSSFPELVSSHYAEGRLHPGVPTPFISVLRQLLSPAPDSLPLGILQWEEPRGSVLMVMGCVGRDSALDNGVLGTYQRRMVSLAQEVASPPLGISGGGAFAHSGGSPGQSQECQGSSAE